MLVKDEEIQHKSKNNTKFSWTPLNLLSRSPLPSTWRMFTVTPISFGIEKLIKSPLSIKWLTPIQHLHMETVEKSNWHLCWNFSADKILLSLIKNIYNLIAKTDNQIHQIFKKIKETKENMEQQWSTMIFGRIYWMWLYFDQKQICRG